MKLIIIKCSLMMMAVLFTACTQTFTPAVSHYYLLSDLNNNRLLLYSSLPSSSTSFPDLVLGQPDFTTSTVNNGGISARSLGRTYSSYFDGTHLIVADLDNHRVLIWNTLPTTSNQNADLVLGQPNMSSSTANNGGISASTFDGPTSIYSNGTRLFITDSANYRVLIWNTFPIENGQAADLVLGQPNMAAHTINNGGVSAQSLASCAVYSDGTRLFVSDDSNNRVLIWNALPTVTQQAANLVLGQPNMNTSAAGTSSTSLSGPWGVSSNGTKVVVADYGNNRVLIWNSLPTINQAAADVVLGQPNMNVGTANNGGVTASSMSGLFHAEIIGSKLFVSDTNNNRVLIWNAIPTINGYAADGVLGQSSMFSATGGTTASSFQSPTEFR